MKVLQIDDSPQICEMFADMFIGEGNSIESVNDGKSGLEKILQNDYDLVLLDIRMPEYSGIDFLQDLKKQKPSELKKIVVTSLLQFDEKQAKKLMEFGIHSIEKKPTSFTQLEKLQKTVSQNNQRNLKVLIINSKIESSKKISEFFESKGFQTIVTANSWDGFHYIQKEKFDVVILDINMTDLNGVQIIKMLATDGLLSDQNIFILPDPLGHSKRVKDLVKREGVTFCFEREMDLDEMFEVISRHVNLPLTPENL